MSEETNDWILTDQHHFHMFKAAFKAVEKFNGLVFTHTRSVCSCGLTQDGDQWELKTDPDYDFDWLPL